MRRAAARMVEKGTPRECRFRRVGPGALAYAIVTMDFAVSEPGAFSTEVKISLWLHF
jgi:hypothetical protein